MKPHAIHSMSRLSKAVLAASAFLAIGASAGEGTRGGGELVRYQGSFELRDLVDKTVCEWKEGHEVLAENPELDRVLDRFARVDWYFANELRREIAWLNYCYTTKLRRVRTEDLDSLTTSYREGTIQAAIRLNGDVYWDKALLDRSSGRTRAFVLIHEAMHSYLRMDTSQRNQKLRSAVATIFRVTEGALRDPRSYVFQMQKNEVQFDFTFKELEPVKDFARVVLNGEELRQKYLLGVTDLEGLHQQSLRVTGVLGHFASWDRKDIDGITLPSILESYCAYDDREVLEHFFKSNLTSFDPMTVCLGNAEARKNPELIDFLLRHVSVDRLVSRIYQALGAADASLVEQRIAIPAGTLELVSEGADLLGAGQVSVLSVRAVSRGGWDQLPAETRAWVYLIGKALAEGEHELVAKWIWNSTDFRSAFDLHPLLAGIEALSPPIRREKAYAQQNAVLIMKAFWAEALKEMAQQAGQDRADEFSRRLNGMNLGYEISNN